MPKYKFVVLNLKLNKFLKPQIVDLYIPDIRCRRAEYSFLEPFYALEVQKY